MSTENTSLKNTIPAGDSKTTNEMVIGKINTYQRTFLIVAGSLLALLVLIAAAGTSGGQHLQSSVHEIAEDAMALADYQVDSTNLAHTNNIIDLASVSGNDEVGKPGCRCDCFDLKSKKNFWKPVYAKEMSCKNGNYCKGSHIGDCGKSSTSSGCNPCKGFGKWCWGKNLTNGRCILASF